MPTAQVEGAEEEGVLAEDQMPAETETPTGKTVSKGLNYLEVRPQKDWFIRTTFCGSVAWYVRFTITGMRARIFGPFPTKRAGLLFLDAAQEQLADFWANLDNVASDFTCTGEYQFITWGPLIEHPLAAPKEKGR